MACLHIDTKGDEPHVQYEIARLQDSRPEQRRVVARWLQLRAERPGAGPDQALPGRPRPLSSRKPLPSSGSRYPRPSRRQDCSSRWPSPRHQPPDRRDGGEARKREPLQQEQGHADRGSLSWTEAPAGPRRGPAGPASIPSSDPPEASPSRGDAVSTTLECHRAKYCCS